MCSRRRSHINTQVSSPSQQNLRCAQTQAAQWLQGEFDSFETTTLPFTSFVKFQSQLWHLECLSPVVESQKNEHSSEDGYGTGDQVLYSLKLSQACEVDTAGPTGQGPCVSS